jgi:thioesterase domain-containing protein
VVLIDPRLRRERNASYYSWRLGSALRRGQLRRLAARRLRNLARGRNAATTNTAGNATIEAKIAALRDAYVLRPLDVQAVLLTSEDYDDLGVPPAVWVEALGDVRRYGFEGSHEHLFLPPAVDHLASALRAALAEAPV